MYTRFNKYNNEIWDDVFQLIFQCKQQFRNNNDNTSLSNEKYDDATCFDDTTEPAWLTFQNSVRRNLQLGNSIFWSEENIYGSPGFETNIRRLASTFLPPSTTGTTEQQEQQQQHEVKVVVTYRRYYQWIVSLYNQENKLSNWRIENVYNDTIYTSISFVQWYRQNMNNNDPDTSGGSGSSIEREVLSETSLELIRSVFSPENVRIFNMHGHSGGDQEEDQTHRGGVVGRFICTEIEQAKGLCQAIQKGEFPELEQVTNARNELLDSQYIIHRTLMDMNKMNTTTEPFLWGGGLLPSNRQHNVAVLELAPIVDEFKQNYTSSSSQQVAESSGINDTDIVVETRNGPVSKEGIPIDCLTDSELDAILQRSLDLEQYLVPEFYASTLEGEGESSLRTEFQQYVNDQKFCSVDYDRLIQELPTWRNFLHDLVYNYTQSHVGEGGPPP